MNDLTNALYEFVTARRMGFAKEVWLDAIRATVPPKTVEVNEKAFTLGYEFDQ